MGLGLSDVFVFHAINSNIMIKKLLFTLLLLLSISAGNAMAQFDIDNSFVSAKIRAGHNSLNGNIFTIASDADYSMDRIFAIRLGEEYDFDDESTTDIRPAIFYDFSFGRLSAEFLLNLYFDSNISGIGLGGGIIFDSKYVWLNVGYYHQTYITKDDKTAKEPFNIYYEGGVRCLAAVESWDLDLVITNSRICNLERHYHPSIILNGRWWLMDDFAIEIGVEYKPSGLFNIANDYNQIIGLIGASFKW